MEMLVMARKSKYIPCGGSHHAINLAFFGRPAADMKDLSRFFPKPKAGNIL